MKIFNSPNNLIVAEPYKTQGVTTTVNKGFASVDQKVNLIPLKVLITSKLATGDSVTANDNIYIKQHTLETNPNYKNALKMNGLDVILVELKDVILVEHTEEEKQSAKTKKP